MDFLKKLKKFFLNFLSVMQSKFYVLKMDLSRIFKILKHKLKAKEASPETYTWTWKIFFNLKRKLEKIYEFLKKIFNGKE